MYLKKNQNALLGRLFRKLGLTILVEYSTCFVLVIEHLPQELRDRFTEMRELDLTVQSFNFTELCDFNSYFSHF